MPLPDDVTDRARLAALDAYAILDTPSEAAFEGIARLAARLCGAPTALVSLVAADRQWFKARVGFPTDETDLDRSVCQYALGVPDLLVIPDLTQDPRTAGNPLVTHEPHVRFYAGAPLRTPEGHVLGSLCVLDTVPRPDGLTPGQAEALRLLAHEVMTQLDLRRLLVGRDALLARQDAALRRERHLDILAEASAALLTASDPGRVLEPILAGGAPALGFDQSFIYDIAPDGSHLALTHAIGASDALRASLGRAEFDGPLCGIVAETRRPLVLTDVLATTEPRYAMARANGINAFAGYPLTSRGRTVGVLSFCAGGPAPFDEGALTFFATLARYLSAVRERLDGEAALRASDARARRAQEAGRVGTFELEATSGLMAVSPEFCRLFGLPAAPFYSMEAVLARILPEDRHHAASEAAVADGSASRAVEYRVRRADDGALRWIAREAQAVRETDRVVRWFGTVRDVTERRAAQDALEASEAHWRGLFERLGEGFLVGEVVRDATGAVRDWRYLEVNSAWGALLGLDPAGVIGRTLREVVPDIEEAWVAEFADVVETGRSVSFVRQVGTLARWYEGRAFPLGAERFGVIFLEITERVRAEARQAALLALGDRLRELGDAQAMTMAVCETLGTVLDAMLVGYGEVDAQRETITVPHDWTTGGAETLAGTLSFRDFGSYVEDLKRGETVVVADCRDDPRTRAHAAALEARSARAFVNEPVFERGAFVSLLYVSTARARTWSPEDLAFIRDVASRLRLAITRVRAEAQREVLNQELSHRLKNTFAMVQAIATQTLRGVPERGPVEAFGKRLQALSGAHDVLLRQAWASAGMRAVVEGALANLGQGARCEVDGPDIALTPQATMSLALILHELTTNALKYGSLAAEAGRVALTWHVAGTGAQAELVLDWQERNGPPVRSPETRGFGSRLIRTGLIGAGGVEVAYPVTGFTARMRAPLAEARQS